MRAAGISVVRIAAPLIGVAALIGAAHFLAGATVLPRTNELAAELRAHIRGVQPASTFGVRQWLFGGEDRLYNFASFSPARGEFQAMSIYRFAPGRRMLAERVEARSARFHGGTWVLRDGWIRTFSEGEETFRAFDEERVALPDPPETFRREMRAPAQMSLAELRAFVQTLRQGGYDARELEVALHEKGALAAAPAVLVLIGLPFSFRAAGRGSLAGIGMALLVAIAFYLAVAACRQFGGLGFLPPPVAAWAPAVAFGGLGVHRLLSVPS